MFLLLVYIYSWFDELILSIFYMFLGQNFLFTSADENSQLKVIDFGLSDFVKPG